MNIYEIAKQAGLSTTTVSRVINNSPHVSDKTRERVLKIIEESGFVPNYFARSLNKIKTKTVGIICPVITDINHSRTVSAIEKYLRIYEFDIILCSVEQNYENMTRYFEIMITKHVDAVFLVGISEHNQENINALAEMAKQIPVIIVNGVLELDNVYSVICNEKYMAVSIVEQLCLSGYSHIAYIYDTTTYSGLKKLEGYKKGLEKSGIPDENLVLQISEDKSMTDITFAVNKILDFLSTCKPMPDAIMTADDVLALAALKALKKMGIKMPVIGWYNSIIAQCSTPTITTVDIGMDKMGETAVSLLLNILNNKRSPKYIEIHAQWIERESYNTGLITNSNDF